ncbi:MAG: hypothetical protein NTY89_00175 [Nostocales cyanobacterium LacPavin_0920_SED1_MAG_38_18]|nr:hypothetical protein [Dolichospermum flos-aquae]MCX5980227.1 hypothetical protein [Nostocales cyanobacterium LacPavin_0920_SED1_MAG_38_18]
MRHATLSDKFPQRSLPINHRIPHPVNPGNPDSDNFPQRSHTFGI